MDLDEHDILTTCALRFDGYAYREQTGFDVKCALDAFFATGEWNLTPVEKLAAFFLLQRALCKWDLVYEPIHGRFWRAFRSLFLLVCEYEVPVAFQPQDGSWREEWERRYRPRLRQCITLVRYIHEHLPYDDTAPPYSHLDGEEYELIVLNANSATKELHDGEK